MKLFPPRYYVTDFKMLMCMPKWVSTFIGQFFVNNALTYSPSALFAIIGTITGSFSESPSYATRYKRNYLIDFSRTAGQLTNVLL